VGPPLRPAISGTRQDAAPSTAGRGPRLKNGDSFAGDSLPSVPPPTQWTSMCYYVSEHLLP